MKRCPHCPVCGYGTDYTRNPSCIKCQCPECGYGKDVYSEGECPLCDKTLTTAEILATTREPDEMLMDAQDTLLEIERIKGIDKE